MSIAANTDVRTLADWDADRLLSLVATHGSPLYVMDLDRVRRNYGRFAAAFEDARVLYAAKANTSRAVLQTLVAAGSGVETASAGETQRALDAGFDASDVHYTAVNPPGEDLDHVVALAEENPALTVTAGARDTIARLRERGYDGRLCIRVNPGIGAGHHEKVRTGADAKFGVPYERATAVLADAAADFDVVGIHAHAGSGISVEELDVHRRFVERMAALARDSPVDLEYVDVGGGFGVPYRPGEPALDLDVVAAATRDALDGVDADLVVEPGRYLVADAGVLLTSVNTVKRAADATVVGVDAGMTTLVRPAMYGAFHDARNLSASDDRSRETVTVTGPICESADVLATDRDLPAPERDDVLAIGNAGAYGYEMASQYNSRPRPAEVVVDGDDEAVSRRRETLADVTRLEQECDWL